MKESTAENILFLYGILVVVLLLILPFRSMPRGLGIILLTLLAATVPIAVMIYDILVWGVRKIQVKKRVDIAALQVLMRCSVPYRSYLDEEELVKALREALQAEDRPSRGM
jgi:hypothetical protein